MQIVPQYINVEDQIVGPLTWKHLAWLFGGSGILLVLYILLDTITFYISVAIIAPIIGALAFARPNGVSMIEFIGYGFNYIFRPRIYTWQRDVVMEKKRNNKQNVKISTIKKQKQLTTDDIAAIAQTLDSRGVERNKKIQEMIKKQQNNNK